MHSYGAYTGEITCEHVKDLGLDWTIIGHSERRHIYKESDQDIAVKVGRAQELGLSTILCIGELLEEREAGKVNEVNER